MKKTISIEVDFQELEILEMGLRSFEYRVYGEDDDHILGDKQQVVDDLHGRVLKLKEANDGKKNR